MTITQESIALFKDQFEDSEDLLALANALLGPVNTIETTLEDLFLKRWVDTAFGMQLDRLGDVVGIPRRGRSDEPYRAAIKFQIFINTSHATPETLITATRVLSAGDFIRYWENYPTGIQLFTNGPNVLNVSGSVIQNHVVALEDGGLLALNDDTNLLLRYTNDVPEALVYFLKQIAPVAVDFIVVSFSLGITPMFGFGEDFLSTTLVTDDGGNFVLENETELQVFTDELTPSLDGFEGFAEMQLQMLILEDEGDFHLSSNVIIEVPGTLEVIGLLERSIEPLIVKSTIEEAGPFMLNDNGIPYELVLEDDSPLEIFGTKLEDIQTSLATPDGASIILEDGGELAVYTRSPVLEISDFYLDDDGPLVTLESNTVPSAGNLILEDGGEFEIIYDDLLDDPGILILFDQEQIATGGGKLIEGFKDG